MYHRCYIYILSLSCVELRCLLSSFVASIIVESPVQRMSWFEVLDALASVVILCEVLEKACCCWRQSPFPFLANCSTEPPVFRKRLIICHCCLSQHIIMSFGLFLSSLGESSFKERSSIIISFLPYATTFTPVNSTRYVVYRFGGFLVSLVHLKFSYVSFERLDTPVL